jgi:hypothetical protein
VKISYSIQAMVIGVLLTAPLLGAERPDLFQYADRAELLVVRITAPNTEGAGVIFHIDDRYLYGITAKHVVFRRMKVVDGLQLELRFWPGRKLPVEILKLHNKQDLAVFRAELASLGLSRSKVIQGVPLDQLGASGELDPGDVLYSLGHSTASAWTFPKTPARFIKEDGGITFLFKSDCPRGYAGGGVFDAQWRLVGMMIEEERPFCRALRIDSVLKIVQGWKLDVSLRPPPPGPDKWPPRQINVAVMGFDNRSTKNLPGLEFVAQDITTSYLHTLPGVALVTRDRLDAVRQEIKLPDMLQTSKGITNVGHLLQADALVTGSIVRYDVERRTFEGYGTTALTDVFRMARSLQILDVESGRVQFSKNFDVERSKHYPKASSAPHQPADLSSELLEALLAQAQLDIRRALTQVVGGLGAAGQLIDVQVSSSPAGADVILNGIYMGKTPKTLQVAFDIHEIRLVLPGYEPWTRRFRAEPSKGIEATLVPAAH